MTQEQYTAIINPICRHCSQIGYACKGVTVKDWCIAKSCTTWEFGYPDYCIAGDLNLLDYLVGSDLNEQNKRILNDVGL